MLMGKINYSRYVGLMRNPKVNKHLLIAEVLSLFSFDDLQAFKRKLPKMFHRILKVPKLKKKCFEDVFVKGIMLPKDTVDIFGSMTFIVLNNATEINRYIKLKNQLILATATQNYSDAYSLLDKIENEVSASMYGTYFGLRLVRLEKGITEGTNVYNQIYKRNSILRYITNINFKISHIDLPLEDEVEKLYSSLLGDEEIRDFTTAIALPFRRPKGDKWLGLLLATSLIDLYEGFMFQLSCLEKERLCNEHIKVLLTELVGSINDIRLQRLFALVNNGKTQESFHDWSQERNLIENYYMGNYDFVIKNGRKYLKDNPLDATILDVYYKSCVITDSTPDGIFPEDSLAGRFHNLYYESNTDGPLSEACRVLLRSLSIAWHQIPQARQIYYNFKDLEQGNYIYENYWRYSLAPEIRDAIFYNDIGDAVNYLETSGYGKDYSSLVEILEGKRSDFANQSRRLLYGFSDGEIFTYCSEVEDHTPTPLLLGCIISQLFNRLMELNRIMDAVSLYVECRLRYPNVKIEVNNQMLVQQMTDQEDAKITNQLKLSIFYTMIGSEIYKRYLAYKRFLRSLNLRRASELDDFSSLELQYFVGKVVDRNVLTLHVVEFDTEEDVVNERIELCKKIYELTNDKAYADEITSLIKEQEVKALTQLVNDSKIHVDVQSLINSKLTNEKLMFETYREIDDNLEIYEQKNIENMLDYIQMQYGGKIIIDNFELASVKYKKVIFRQIFMSLRDKFLFDPIYGLDKYLSARIRHGTLLTQLRNHFLTHSLVTNKKDGGDYESTNPWMLRKEAGILNDEEKNSINERMLQFTAWLDNKLRIIKNEVIQIKTERNNGAPDGLFDYSYDKMNNMIEELESNNFESFDAFVRAAVDLLWKWTNSVLERIRLYFNQYEDSVVKTMETLQRDVVKLMRRSPLLVRDFKDEMTACYTEFQKDIAVVTSWFKPEQSNVRFFTLQQAVDTSLAVINKINQNALRFNKIRIEDGFTYDGEYFNAIHDIFHDMMNNILGYERQRKHCKGKGEISIKNTGDRLYIEVSNPLDDADIPALRHIVEEQKNIPALIASGKTRRENNSGCTKIFSTVMYTLGSGNKYENVIKDNRFFAHIEIATKNLMYNENTNS